LYRSEPRHERIGVAQVYHINYTNWVVTPLRHSPTVHISPMICSNYGQLYAHITHVLNKQPKYGHFPPYMMNYAIASLDRITVCSIISKDQVACRPIWLQLLDKFPMHR
jgi:hypothetical protein